MKDPDVVEEKFDQNVEHMEALADRVSKQAMDINNLQNELQSLKEEMQSSPNTEAAGP
jgi:uncharacterized coiled-coil protein SlyX